MPTTQTDLEGTAKAILAWGSVSYACGFVTVLLHTWRLGLPVVELIEPIYIWIGLPLAIVAFFWKHLLLYFRGKSSKLAADFRSSTNDLLGKVAPEEINLVAEVLRVLETFPGAWLFLRGPVRRFITDRLGSMAELLQNANPAVYQAQVHALRRAAGLSRFVDAIGGALGFLTRVVAIPAALAVYVWAIYPLIPQSLGGGRATPVQIVVKSDSLPPELLVQSMPAAEPKDVATKVLVADMLYMTKEFFFVELQSGVRLSIEADAVKAVVWSPMNSP